MPHAPASNARLRKGRLLYERTILNCDKNNAPDESRSVVSDPDHGEAGGELLQPLQTLK